MKNNLSLSKISKTGDLKANLILRQYMLDLTARYTEVNSSNPKVGQDQIPSQLGLSTSILQRYRNETNMPSSYRVQKSLKKTERFKYELWWCSKTLDDLKWPHKTSNGLK